MITDADGVYEINAVSGDFLEFSFIGYEKQRIQVGKSKLINVIMKEHTEMLEEAVVVAFGKQAKESVVASISTVSMKELRSPTSNLTTALAGKSPDWYHISLLEHRGKIMPSFLYVALLRLVAVWSLRSF